MHLVYARCLSRRRSPLLVRSKQRLGSLRQYLSIGSHETLGSADKSESVTLVDQRMPEKRGSLLLTSGPYMRSL